MKKVFLGFLMTIMTSVLFVPVKTFGAGVEYEIVCPPNEGITLNGNFSDEPLKKNLKNGNISRIQDAVKRAIAQLACDNQSQIGAGATCGDNVAEGAEVCDGSDLKGETCVSKGFDSGTLACNATCGGFDTSSCTGGSCTDGIQNQDETDVDCGGSICSPCQDGQGCTDGSDCVNGVCSSGTCGLCPSGLTNCGGSCVDTSTDVNNCGECSIICNIGETCTGGICQCPDNDGDTYMDIICGGNDCNDADSTINPSTDERCDSIDNNCDGIIDNDTVDCDPSQICVSGSCQ